jgi:hypothetical protein
MLAIIRSVLLVPTFIFFFSFRSGFPVGHPLRSMTFRGYCQLADYTVLILSTLMSIIMWYTWLLTVQEFIL